MASFLIVLGIIIIDQISKYSIVQSLTLGSSSVVIDNFFQLTYVENTGIAFSLLQNNNIFMIALMSVTSMVLLGLIFSHKPIFLKVSLSVLLGGTIGNLMDRLFRGKVIDFFDFHFYDSHFAIFNVADICVVLGSALLIYYIIINDKNKRKGII